ncbi:MAG: DNA-binding response regulator [Chloroflexi bacterium]|nr:MAG: DNA-binding response regulator [Chloroflexota bacterium]
MFGSQDWNRAAAVCGDLPMTKQILVVEDDRQALEEVVDCLKTEGYSVRGVGTAEQADLEASSLPVSLVIVDLGLPGEDGLTFARRVRSGSKAGIIIVTGRTDAVDRIVGLELGADDYVCKPFNPRELLARVKSVLRRTGDDVYPELNVVPRALVLEFDDWALNTFSRELHDPDGKVITLTTAEYELMRTFLESPSRVHTRDYLMDHVFGRDRSPADRAIDGLISRLRKKLSRQGKDNNYINTVRSAGYVFTRRVNIREERS